MKIIVPEQTFLAFSLASQFGASFMFLMKDNGYEELSGALNRKLFSC
jgi:hypothetical protein